MNNLLKTVALPGMAIAFFGLTLMVNGNQSAPSAAPLLPLATDTANIGNGTAATSYPFTTLWEGGRTQMLYKASELMAAGVAAGQISSIGFNVISNSPQVMNGFTVRIGHTSVNLLTDWAAGLTTCYSGSWAVPGTGWQDIPLTTPFNWNGTSNIVVEVCYAGTGWSSSSPVYGTLVADGIHGHYMDGNSSECSQVLANTNNTTPRPNIRFAVNSFILEPPAQNVSPNGGSAAFAIQATGVWSATCQPPWCTVTPSGSGNGTITANYSTNMSATPRTAYITVTTAGSFQHAVTLIQGGVAAPVNVLASVVDQNVTVTWNPPPGTTGVTGYNIYRFGVKINTMPVAGTSYYDGSLPLGMYKYTVTALYGAMESQHAGPEDAIVGSHVVVGNGSITAGYPYYTYYMGARTQMLYRADDLIASGASAGWFYSIGFNVNSAQAQVMQNFTIKMGLSIHYTLTGWVTAGMNTFYSGTYSVPGTGWQDIGLSSPFYWDGTSGIIVEICYGDNTFYTSNSLVFGTTAPGRVWHAHNDNYAGCNGGLTGAAEAVVPNIRFKTNPLQNTPLPAPSNIQLSVTGNQVQINWTPPSPAPGLVGHMIYIAWEPIPLPYPADLPVPMPYPAALPMPMPMPATSLTLPYQANGEHMYLVTAVYPNGESTAQVDSITVSMGASPPGLIAGGGFNGSIPLNWSFQSGDAPAIDYYKIYRRSGTTGSYTLIGNTQGYGMYAPNTCYVDQAVLPGMTYCYMVTGVTGGIEGNVSNMDSAACGIARVEQTAAPSENAPLIDGVINSGEWLDATPYAITNFSRVGTLPIPTPYPVGTLPMPIPYPVNTWCKRVGNFLYIAVKDNNDSTNNADRLGICFDNNGNGIFDGTDGELWIDRVTAVSVQISYRQFSGSFPSIITIGTPVLNPTGVTAAIQAIGTRTEYEVQIDLVNSPLHPQGDSFLYNIYTTDPEAGNTGYYPDGHVWIAPQTYGKMNVITNPPTAPVTTASSVQGIPGAAVNVPITVDIFPGITAFSLALEYDPSVIVYTSFANVASGLSGVTVNDVHVSTALHRLMITWSYFEGKTLPAGSRLLDLIFSYLSGSTALVWNTAINGGTDCEYYGSLGSPLPDTPPEAFYIDGSVQGIAPVVNLSNMNVVTGMSACYNATQVINVAGGGSTFLVQSGGSAMLIAGQRVSMFPGTTVEQGGYLEAHITTSGQYCNTWPPAMPVVVSGVEQVQQGHDPWLVRVWPNPTTGSFTLAVNPQDSRGDVRVELYDMQGVRILSEGIADAQAKEYSLADHPAGIYLLRVVCGGRAETVKVVRQ